jgi:hypothetical protein
MLPVLPKLTEKAFMAQVVRYANMMGWHSYHPFDSRRSAPGFPDLVLIRRPRVVWAELKSQRGKLTPDQLTVFCELRACNQEIYVWRPDDWPKVERILR